jgi:tripartite-type tricarboxylate transporter receptor subunit TctC
VVPDVPTVAEAGVPGYAFTTWYGVLAPAATSPQVIGTLNDHVVKAMHAPDMAARFAHEGAELIASSPAQFAAYIKAEITRWGKVVREADGLRAE